MLRTRVLMLLLSTERLRLVLWNSCLGQGRMWSRLFFFFFYYLQLKIFNVVFFLLFSSYSFITIIIFSSFVQKVHDELLPNLSHFQVQVGRSPD
jgi:hypothetical protein